MSCFSVTWRIENFSMCVKKPREVLNSLGFVLPELSNITWNIVLYPRGDMAQSEGDYISFYIKRRDKDPKAKEIKLSTSFKVVNNYSMLSKEITSDNFVIKNNECRGYAKFISYAQLYKNAKGFLPNGVLKIQLQIRPMFDCEKIVEVPKNVFSLNPLHLNFTIERCSSRDSETINKSLTHCSFLTRIPVERRVLNWVIKNLSAKRKSKEKISVSLESEVSGIKFLLVCYVKGTTEESLWIDIFRKGTDRKRAFVKCEISFLDGSNVARGSKESEHLFDDAYQRWSFPLIDNLSSSINLIVEDSLQMKCDFSISYEHQNAYELIESHTDRDLDLHAEIQKMAEYELTSDVSLECRNGKKFSAHKFLLFAKSPVFREMFASDTLERQTGVIRMLDTDPGTVQHLRDYLYLKNSPDLMGIEEAIKLYSVAVSYQMKQLKNKCAGVLKNNVTVENVCRILTIADMYHDPGLKSYAYEFLNAEMDFDSSVWKEFMAENLELAEETLRRCVIKGKKSS